MTSNLNAGATQDNQYTPSILRDSVQAGEAIIDFGDAKKVKAMYYKPNLGALGRGMRQKNMFEIDLHSNSEISNILKSSMSSQPKGLQKRDVTFDRIQAFEDDFRPLHANQTVDNYTSDHYLSLHHKTGKAKRLKDKSISN
jgi:hypothetical protein